MSREHNKIALVCPANSHNLLPSDELIRIVYLPCAGVPFSLSTLVQIEREFPKGVGWKIFEFYPLISVLEKTTAGQPPSLCRYLPQPTRKKLKRYTNFFFKLDLGLLSAVKMNKVVSNHVKSLKSSQVVQNRKLFQDVIR